MKKILQICTVLILLGACTAMETTRGNFVYVEDVALIEPLRSTQSDVLNTLGTPTTKAVFDENTWYYIGLKTEKESFFDEKVVARQVYKIAFDDAGVVQSIAEEATDTMDIPIASRVTPTSGNEITFVQQVLGNIGKFNPPTQ